jgi:hypothetical protein
MSKFTVSQTCNTSAICQLTMELSTTREANSCEAARAICLNSLSHEHATLLPSAS